MINLLKSVDFSQILGYGYPGVAINTFIMYLCSIINLPSLYPFLLISLGFFLILTIFNKIGHKIPNNENLLIFIFVLFEMFPRYYFSGLRNHFVFIILTCLILHYYLNKSHKPITFLIYFFICIVSCLIHNSVIMIVCILLFYELFFVKMNSTLKKICIFGIIFAIPIFMSLSYLIGQLYPELLENIIIHKLYVYSFRSFYIYSYVQYFLLLGIVLFNSAIGFYVKSKSKFVEYKKYNDFFCFILIFCIALLPNMTVLMRFIYLISFMSIPILMQLFAIIDKRKTLYKVLKLILVVFILLLILYIIVNIKSYPWEFNKSYMELLFPFY